MRPYTNKYQTTSTQGSNKKRWTCRFCRHKIATIRKRKIQWIATNLSSMKSIDRKEIIPNIAEWKKSEWSKWKGTNRKRNGKPANRTVCSWRKTGQARARRKTIGWSQPRSLRIWIAEDSLGRSKQNIWISRTSALVTIKSVDQFIIVIFCSIAL